MNTVKLSYFVILGYWLLCAVFDTAILHISSFYFLTLFIAMSNVVLSYGKRISLPNNKFKKYVTSFYIISIVYIILSYLNFFQI